MSQRANGPTAGPDLASEVYGQLMDRAKTLSRSAIDQLHRLHDRFPDDIPDAAVSRVQRDAQVPFLERRLGRRQAEGQSPVRLRGSGLLPGEVARIADTSPGGVGLLVRSPAQVGSVLELCPVNTSDYPCSTRARVRHCQAEGSRWWLGCELLDD